MNEKLAYLQAYNTEPDPVEEEDKGGGAAELLDSALPTDPIKAPVKVDVGERAGQTLDAAKNQKSIIDTALKTKKSGQKVLGSAVPSLEDLPTPPTGGIGLLLFISLLIVFAITPVKGMGTTRLNLIWQSLLGNYSISGGGGSSGAPSGGSSGGANNSPLPPDPLNPSWYIQGGA